MLTGSEDVNSCVHTGHCVPGDTIIQRSTIFLNFEGKIPTFPD